MNFYTSIHSFFFSCCFRERWCWFTRWSTFSFSSRQPEIARAAFYFPFLVVSKALSIAEWRSTMMLFLSGFRILLLKSTDPQVPLSFHWISIIYLLVFFLNSLILIWILLNIFAIIWNWPSIEFCLRVALLSLYVISINIKQHIEYNVKI